MFSRLLFSFKTVQSLIWRNCWRLPKRNWRLSKVLIAAVNGIAVGLGAEIAIACDIRLASENAVFGFPEAQRGLFVTNGVKYFLPRLVGMGRATEWLLTGETISVPGALHTGLVKHVVPWRP